MKAALPDREESPSPVSTEENLEPYGRAKRNSPPQVLDRPERAARRPASCPGDRPFSPEPAQPARGKTTTTRGSVDAPDLLGKKAMILPARTVLPSAPWVRREGCRRLRRLFLAGVAWEDTTSTSNRRTSPHMRWANNAASAGWGGGVIGQPHPTGQRAQHRRARIA